jgi:hypothetical protein
MKLAPLLILLASPALADDFIFFHSPTGNINCMLASGDYAGARCDMREFTPSFRNRPADCDLEWGDAFEVGVTGRGSLSCHGDTVIDPGSMELGYGASATLGDFTCTSLKTGMTCTNARGHGFAISKAAQKLF